MKDIKYIKSTPTIAPLLLLVFAISGLGATPLGTAFTYQGKLTDGGPAASGSYDLRFAIYDTASGGNRIAGPITNSPVDVTSGMFTTTLDFGAGVFTGEARWLEIAVRTNGGGGFVTFPNRQSLTPTPYALFAANSGGTTTALDGTGTPDFLPRFTASQILGDSVVRQAGGNVGIGGPPEQKLDVHGGDLLVRGPGGFDATGEWATLFLGDANHSLQGIYGTGLVARVWSGEKLSVDSGNLLVRGADNFAGAGSVATTFLGDTAHYLRATREYGLALATWPVGDVLTIREPLGRVGIGTTEPQQKFDVSGGDIQVRGPGGFDATGEQATVFLGDGNHFIRGIYGTGVVARVWSGEKLFVDSGNLQVRGADNFAGAGSVATAYLGDTVHYLRATREYGLTLATWPVGDALTIREPTGNVGIGTTSPTSRLTVRGNVTVQSATTGNTVAEIGEGLDYAEGFDVTGEEKIAPGTVLVIDAAHPGQLTISREAYDRKVAGIVAGAKGLGSGVRLGADQFDHPVALAGRVYCNVDGKFGAVQPGDLLTTSPTAGHAMVVKDHGKATGAILGKAMEPLAAGKQGQVLVLVTLQ